MADSGVYYRSERGDVLDQVVWSHYGKQTDRLVEQVLEANRGLADYGPVLPAGLRIRLPVFEDQVAVEVVRLWT